MVSFAAWSRIETFLTFNCPCFTFKAKGTIITCIVDTILTFITTTWYFIAILNFYRVVFADIPIGTNFTRSCAVKVGETCAIGFKTLGVGEYARFSPGTYFTSRFNAIGTILAPITNSSKGFVIKQILV